MLQLAGEIKSFEYEPYFELRVNDKKICGIKPDFLIHYKNGVNAIHETKGMATSAWFIKWNLMQALHPEFVYQVVK